MKLDLSKFKKIRSDKHSTLMRHDDGHFIRVAHKSLSDKMRQDLIGLPEHPRVAKAKGEMPVKTDKTPAIPKMAEGGEVAMGKSKKPVSDAVMPAPAVDQDKWSKFQEGFNKGLGGGGSKKKFATGGEVTDEEMAKKPIEINIGTPGTVQMPGAQALNPMPGAQFAQRQAEQPKVVPVDPVDEAAQKTFISPEQAAMLKDAAKPMSGQPIPQAVPRQPQSDGITMVPNAPKADAGMAPVSQDPFKFGAQYQGMMGGSEDIRSGMKAQAAAEIDLQKNLEKTYQEKVKRESDLVNLLKQNQQRLQDVVKKSLEQVKEVNPNEFMDKMGTGQKVMTAIGLLMGGIGQGLIGGENPALQFLNKQIERNIQAQMANRNREVTMLGQLTHALGSEHNAIEALRVIEGQRFATLMQQQIAKVQDPMIKAKLMQQLGQFNMQEAQALQPVAAKMALMQGMRDGTVAPERVINVIVPENRQPEATKELKEANEMSAARDNLLSGFDQVSKLQTISSRALSPIQSKAQIAAITGPLIAGLSKATAGRFTEQDAKMIEPLFPEITDNDETRMVKRRRLQQLIEEKMHFPTLQFFGIDPKSMGQFSSSGQPKIKEMPPVIQ